MSQLHILNGDGMHDAFQQNHFSGEVVIWREVLCEGPTSDIGTASFWETRKGFMEEFFGASEEDYTSKVLAPFQQIQQASTYDEVILWFEYDLFCQINLIGLLAWLRIHASNTTISVVTVGKHPHYSKLVGFGELNPEEYKPLFENRIELQASDLDYAYAIWEAYCSNNPNNLRTALAASTAAFPYLKEALFAHFQRFPSTSNGLNEIEQFILERLQVEASTPEALVKQCLTWENVYGFGDAQYFVYLKHLMPLIDYQGTMQINDLGTKVLQNNLDFIMLQQQSYTWGGAKNTHYRWNASTQTLDRIS